MDLNAKKCLSTGGNVTLGYVVDKDKKFQVDPESALTVKYIFESYVKGDTVTKITENLNNQGFKNPRGRKFSKSSVMLILQNKRYIGIYTYKGTETPGGIPRIISDELFNKAADKFAKNKKAPARLKAQEEYILTTKLFCGHCKEMMVGYSGTSRNGKVHHYYACKNRIKKEKTCAKQYVQKDYIENLVIDKCREILTADNIAKIAKEIVSACEKGNDLTEMKRLEKQLKDIERKQNNLMNAIMECDNDVTRKLLFAEVPKLEDAKTAVEDEIIKEEKNMIRLTEEQVRFFLSALKKGAVNDIKYRKSLVSVFVNKIYLYNDKITFIFDSSGTPMTVNTDTLEWIDKHN